MNELKVARELLTLAKGLMAKKQTILRDGVLSVVKDDIYGIFCYVNGDPKMRKRNFVGKYYMKVSQFMHQLDLEKNIIGTINFKAAQRSLDMAFRDWVNEEISRGGSISAKTMDGIDMDDGGDDYGNMWHIEDDAVKSGYVLKNGYYVKG